MTLTIAAKAACVSSQLEDRVSKGFRAVEITTFENEWRNSIRQMQRILYDYSHSLEFVAIHTPNELTISDAIDEDVRKRGLSCLEKAIKLAARVDCKRVVFHAFQSVSKLGSMSEMIPLRDKALKKCAEGVRSLEPLCEDLDMTLCLENINAHLYLGQVLYCVFTTSPSDLLRVTKEVNSNFLKICFDVAHAHNACNFMAGNPGVKALFGVNKLTLERFFELVADRTDLIHLSDAKGSMAGKESDHLPLGQGEIDFRRVLKSILAKGFEGLLVLETGETDINNAVNMVKGRELLSHIVAELRPR